MYGSTLYIVLRYTSSPDGNTVKEEGLSPIQRKMVSSIPGHKVLAWVELAGLGVRLFQYFTRILILNENIRWYSQEYNGQFVQEESCEEDNLCPFGFSLYNIRGFCRKRLLCFWRYWLAS